MRNKFTIYEIRFLLSELDELKKSNVFHSKNKFKFIEYGEHYVSIYYYMPESNKNFDIFKKIQKLTLNYSFLEVHLHIFTFFEWQYNMELNKDDFQFFIDKNIIFSWSADKVKDVKEIEKQYLKILSEKK